MSFSLGRFAYYSKRKTEETVGLLVFILYVSSEEIHLGQSRTWITQTIKKVKKIKIKKWRWALSRRSCALDVKAESCLQVKKSRICKSLFRENSRMAAWQTVAIEWSGVKFSSIPPSVRVRSSFPFNIKLFEKYFYWFEREGGRERDREI